MKNRVITALLSIAIAFGLWLYVITFISTEKEDTFYDIPVSFRNESILEDRGLMITDRETPTVTLELSGSRSNMNKLNRSNITLVVDLSTIFDTGEQKLSYTIIYPGDIPANSIVEKNRDPGQITLNIERHAVKEVPVELVFSGKVPEEYIVDEEHPVLDYEEVTVSGPASVVDQIAQAQIEIDLEGQTESISGSYRYRLCDKDGQPVDSEQVKTNVAEVAVTVKIQRTKQIKLTATVIEGGGATESTTTIEFFPSVITVSGSASVLDDLEELNLGTIDLSDHPSDKVLVFPINLPNGVTSESGETEATASVKFSNLGTKTIDVTTIRPINVPEGMEVELLTQVLKVTLRGPKSLINVLEASDVTVTVDFSGRTPGTATIGATVTLSPGFGSVGAVGSLSVSATLREIEEPVGEG